VARYVTVGIVAVGAFNPAIFHPEWFRTHDLLPAVEIDAALGEGGVLAVTPQQTFVRFESMELIVTDARWEIRTERMDWHEDLGGVVASIFALLSHTPVSAVGLNRTGHYQVRGGARAKLARWLPLEDLCARVGDESSPGAVVRAKWNEYAVTLNLEPSALLKADEGIYVNQNYERRKLKSALELVGTVEQDWSAVLERSDQVVREIIA
jgi:hypothetical protein